MVKDFTTSQFSVFNYRKNIINKRSNSLMPLWPQMEKTKRWKKRGKEGIEPLLLKYLSPYSWRWVSGNSQHSIQGVLCVLCTHTVYLWMGCVCLSMWRGREGERETEREMLKEVRCYGLTICHHLQHLFISFNIYFQNPNSQCNNI